MKKRLLCLSLALLMSGTQVLPVLASREDELRQAQVYTNAALNDTYAKINELENQKAAIRESIGALNENLMNLMVSTAVLEDSIAQKEDDIVKTASDLEKAEKARDKQYEDMKKRIQLLYEKGGDTAWFQMLMEAEDVSDLLTRAEYTQKLYDHDRECLEKYVDVVDQVTKLGEKHQTEKAQLEEMHNEYTLQQQELENQIANLEATSSNYEAEIAYAQDQAYTYAAILEQQTAEIAQLEAERIAAEQAAAQAAAEAAAAQAAAEAAAAQAAAEAAAAQEAAEAAAAQEAQEAAAAQEAETVQTETPQYDEYGNVVGSDTAEPTDYYEDTTADTAVTDTVDYTTTDTAVTDTVDYATTDTTTQYDSYGNVIVDDSSITTDYSAAADTTTTDTTTTDTATADTTTTTTSTSESGSSVVDYATQFVGNPYVWGGTSLTSGADCSGFVQSVYSNFGIDLPRTSYDQMNVGTEVSYSDAQPGDLICYGGHVAIYMGDGQIVHAANEEQGIIISDNAAYDTILSVRRLS